MGRKEPGPAEEVVPSQRLDDRRAPPGYPEVDLDPAGPDDPEAVGTPALFEDACVLRQGTSCDASASRRARLPDGSASSRLLVFGMRASLL